MGVGKGVGGGGKVEGWVMLKMGWAVAAIWGWLQFLFSSKTCTIPGTGTVQDT
jgi:hypothetical protein